MRIAVAATPEVAIPTLNLLIESGFELGAVITQPDRPAGRGLSLKASPVAEWAIANKVAVFKPEGQDQLSVIVGEFDLVITIGYGVLIKQELLNLPKFGFINLHFSLLPKWRGAAPVQRAIEAGDAFTGVTVFKLDRGMDTGPIFKQIEIPLPDTATTDSLLGKLAQIGAPVVVETIRAIEIGEMPIAQISSQSTRAEKISKEQALIDWSASAEVLERKIRAFHPSPGAWTTFRGEVLKIEAAALSEVEGITFGHIEVREKKLLIGCGRGSIEITEIKPAGKSTMSASAWLNGARISSKDRFG